MKPSSFTYHSPRSIAEAVTLIGLQDAKALAGGQSLMPVLAMRLGRFAHLVDLGRVNDLRHVERVGDRIVIGAMVTQTSIGRDLVVARDAPLLAAATPLIGHFQIRNRGTVGGSVSHADPAAEYPAVALVLDAELVVEGPRGSRTLPAGDFFRSALMTDVASDELLLSIRLPVAEPRTGYSIKEVARRPGDFAVAGVACAVTVDEEAVIVRARVGLFGVAPTAIRATSIEDALVGAAGDADVADIARFPVDAIDPATDVHASARYRRHLTGVLMERAIRAAMRSAVGGPDVDGVVQGGEHA